MKSLKHNVWLRLIKLLNAVLMTIPFGICWYISYADTVASPFYRKGNLLIVALYFIVYITYGRIYEAFMISLHRISEMVISQMLSSLITNGIIYLVIWLLTKHIPSVLPLLVVLLIQIIISAAWSKTAHIWYFKTFSAKKTVVIYDQYEAMNQLISEYGMDKKFDVVNTAFIEDALRDNLEILNDAETVFLCDIHSKERNVIIKHCVTHNIQAYVIPRIGDLIMSGAHRMHMFHLPILRVERCNPNPEYLFLKRLFDIVSSGLALIIFSPIMLVVAGAIKLTDRGPVFYKQCRLTKNGKTFNVLKFRSMRVDAEKDGVARLSSGKNDSRITPVGKFIRKCRLDELPQLINILKGEMSVVGPRPERPEIAQQYEQELPEFALRLQVKAGLTGYAQVYGKYNTSPYNKLQMDLMYIANPSFIEDLKIIFATIKILFQSESTEGIDNSKTTAAR